MTKVDLITGILGSGKTAFLRKYARYLIDSGQKIAILENDFGAVNADMAMLRDLQCENCQLEMVMGVGDADCHRRRFKTQLISLGMQHFDRIIIEPSGIFDMDEFFDTLHESPLDRWFEIGSILTIVDAETEDNLTEQMEYLFGAEASCCGKIILSKVDSVENIEEVSEKILNHLNRSLEMIKCDRVFKMNDIFIRSNFSENDYKLLMNVGYRGSSYVKLFSPEDIRSSVHYFMHINLPFDKTEDIIKGIFDDEKCGNVFRIKGSLPHGENSCTRINFTREKHEISETESGQPVIIVIGDDLNREAIDRHFIPFNTDPEYVSI